MLYIYLALFLASFDGKFRGFLGSAYITQLLSFFIVSLTFYYLVRFGKQEINITVLKIKHNINAAIHNDKTYFKC